MTGEPTDYPFFFTWTEQRRAAPLDITGGRGVHLIDRDGEQWLDLGSLSYQANLGYGHREVVAAIKRQAEAMCLAMPTAVFPAKLELARRLLELAPPGFSRVFFTLGGAEAIENALKMARMVTGRHKLIARYRSYHGATMGALSLSGDWRRILAEPGLPGVVRALDCHCDHCPFGRVVTECGRECASHIGDLMALEGPNTVAAVVLESVVGANGVLVPPPEYWPMVRDACDRHGVLLIADEVLTGFGRTGRWFGFQHWEAVPDMIVLAKGLTGGYAPLGAVLVNDRVAGHFDENILACGLTSYAHPLGCAAALAAIEAYQSEELVARARTLGPVLRAELDAVRAANPARITHVRSIGLLAAMEVDAPHEVWAELSAGLVQSKILLHVYPRRGLLVFAPPLCIEESLLRQAVRTVAEIVNRACQKSRHNSAG
ncbi:MAG: aminotransferase class III-fold pyridoxal phosphate-dependent enzyme [Proteobacteria bacterium]|nr:aminotransferase class III-fold pyridoxal phosphate-dependent enzyme [Pseudomonadota bacterium]